MSAIERARKSRRKYVNNKREKRKKNIMKEKLAIEGKEEKEKEL